MTLENPATGMRVCPTCQCEFKRLTTHWGQSDCPRPDVPERVHELLTGVMMGDAHVKYGSKYPMVILDSASREFVEWTRDQLGIFGSRNISVSEGRGTTMYTWPSIAHPEFERYARWYDSGRKRFPDDLVLTPEIARMWYVCDGCLSFAPGRPNTRPSPIFGVSNERDRGDFLEALFAEQGFEARSYGHTLRVSSYDTNRFLEWIGDPVPGYEYKWDTRYESRF